MNTLDIVLINVICYLGGILSGLGVCFKYKKHLLLRTSSKEQLSENEFKLFSWCAGKELNLWNYEASKGELSFSLKYFREWVKFYSNIFYCGNYLAEITFKFGFTNS